MGIYDVPSGYLIEETAQVLAKEIPAPPFTAFAKSGVSRERAPQREDWFSVRMASILYRTYKWGTIGTERLRSYYGGRKNRGLKREHQYKASGKVIRSAVQLLEKAGYIEKAKPKGRKITAKGMQLLNETSKITDANLKAGKYVKKERKVVDDKRKAEVREALKAQERGQESRKNPQPQVGQNQKKPAKAKDGE